MRKSLDEHTRLTLVKSLILSKLDYSNFLYANLPNNQIQKLQKCLNAAVRFIYNVRKSSSITPYLKKAHILPIKYRITYKLCFYGFKILNGYAPTYLKNMVHSRNSNRHLRSATDETVLETNHAASTIAHRLCVAWNALPRDIREAPNIEIFKTQLKTHLFRQAFE